MIPQEFYNNGKIVASRLNEKWIKENLYSDYLEIKNVIIDKFPIDYIPSSYSEYIYVLYLGINNNHICNNTNCNNVAVYKKISNGFLDYCSKKCKSGHTRLIKRERILNNTIDEKLILENKTNNHTRIFKREINNIFYNKRGKIDANKFNEKWILKYVPEMHSNINDILLNIPFNEKLYLYLFNLSEIPKCKTCGNELLYKGSIRTGYGTYCNSTCVRNDINMQKTKMQNFNKKNFEKYGKTNYFRTDEFKVKLKQTSLKKYNTEFPSQSEIVKTKINNTVIKKYGSKQELGKIAYKKGLQTLSQKYGIEVSSCMDIKEIVDKIKKTNLLRYNTESLLSKGTVVRNLIEKTNLKKYGCITPIGNKLVKERVKMTIFNKIKSRISKTLIYDISESNFIDKGIYNDYKFTCKKCGNIFFDTLVNTTYKTITCKKCRPRNISKYELEIRDVLHSELMVKLDDIKLNDRNILNGKEIDILLKGYRLGIEYDGLYFHSVGKSKFSMFNNYLNEKIIQYIHFNKTELSIRKGYTLFHIFENEWKLKRTNNIWKSIIKTKLGKSKNIDINELYLENITDQDIIKKFLDNNHLEGFISSDITIGLFSKISQELVCLMSFSENNVRNNNIINNDIVDDNNTNKWKISKYATMQGYDIISGYNKIFDYFVTNYIQSGQKIIGIDNLRYSNGEIYKQLGFSHIRYSKPDYFYFKEGTYILEDKTNYQKSKLKETLDNFDDNLSESENMYNNGYRKIYDCGNTIFEFIKLEI